MRTLIVDDSEEFAGSVSRLLGSQGLDVVGCALTGDEALELAARLAPELALIDVELGEEDGIELSHRFAAQAPATRVILISSYGPDDLGDLIRRSPAVGFLPKTDLGVPAITALLS